MTSLFFQCGLLIFHTIHSYSKLEINKRFRSEKLRAIENIYEKMPEN